MEINNQRMYHLGTREHYKISYSELNYDQSVVLED